MSLYKIRAKGTESAELLIYGDIGDSWWNEESNDAKSVVTEMNGLNGVPLDVRINSYGGVVADGLAIHNAIRRYPGSTTIHIDGVAFSVASLIAMAGDKVHMADNALMMIHAPWGLSMGNAEAMRDMADTLDLTAEAMAKSYLRDGGPSAAQIDEWLQDGEDHYFTADRAQELGLVDEITESIDIAAALRGVDRFKPPAMAGTTGKRGPKMANDDGNNDGPDVADDNYVQQHQKAVNAGLDKGRKAENARQTAVRAAFDGLTVDDDPTDPMLALMGACLDDVNCDEVATNRRILAALKQRTDVPIPQGTPQSPTGGVYPASRPSPVTRVTSVADAADKLVEGATLALMVREGMETDPEKVKAERGSEFLSMSLTEIAKVCAYQSGIPTQGTREQVLRRVLAAGPGQGTDHFPAILENIANKGVMDGFMAAEETWQEWTQPGTLQDYRAATRVNKSLFDKLDKMYENQEFEAGKFADVKQAIQGFLHGKEFSLTLQAMVNDDLGMLVGDTMAWGEAANVTIGDAVFTALTAAGTSAYGQTMTEDSTALFHADHSNFIDTGSGGAPADATISAGRTAMMTQTDPNSRIVASRPRFLLHGTALTTAVFTLLNSQYNITGASATLGELNAVRSLGIVGVEEYRFDGFVSTAWIMAAARRTVEVAFVGGQRTPIVDRLAQSSIPGVSWQISIPFGVAAMDYRTLYFNYGA